MFFVIDIKILILTKMDTLPYEIVDHIASYLNKNDLVNYATVNSEYNNILSKRVAYEKEKYNYDRYINHNRMVTLMYIRDRERQYYMRKYYKRCIICGREVSYVLMGENFVFCFKCQYKVSEDIKEILDSYNRNTCDCIMREVRMMILNNVDESKINEMFTLETRSNFNHDKDKPCLALLYSFYSPKVIKIGERNDNDEVDNTYNTDESEDESEYESEDDADDSDEE
jgi:hypothetical protein